MSERPDYHFLPRETVFKALNFRPEGLSPDEARARLETYGYNELSQSKGISPAIIFLRQFANLLMIILIIATVISFLLGEQADAWVILAVILACVLLGFFQEYRAEKAAAALEKMAAPHAIVRRDNREKEIPVRKVVPGDTLILRTGDKVAADAASF